VPAGDEEAFVAALSRIIRDRSLRQELGDAGLEFVEVNYSKERLFEDIKELYGELSHEKAQKAEMLPATGASLRRH
jgi:glycosyltransferase involved in cell wall biosynthesis